MAKVHPPATILKRLGAFIIDLFILDIFILFPFNIVLKNKLNVIEIKDLFSLSSEAMMIAGWISAMAGVVIVLYFSLFEYQLLKTPGKMLMRISMKKKYPLGKLIISNLSFLPIFPFFLLLIFDLFYLIFKSGNQRFMEKIMGVEQVA